MNRRINSNIYLVISMFLLVMVSAATAKTIFVDVKANGNNNGSSWADAYNHLQDALAAASNGDEIWVTEGIYKPDQGNGIRLGISAMPSMHTAAALLFALAGWHLNRKLGIALFIFTGMILLGSVHLAWHYAIDGYAGIAIALIAWWVSGIVARKWEAGAWAQDYARALKRQSTQSA